MQRVGVRQGSMRTKTILSDHHQLSAIDGMPLHHGMIDWMAAEVKLSRAIFSLRTYASIMWADLVASNDTRLP
jgi:hypothetical protein